MTTTIKIWPDKPYSSFWPFYVDDAGNLIGYYPLKASLPKEYKYIDACRVMFERIYVYEDNNYNGLFDLV
jgi:hypothetical protein